MHDKINKQEETKKALIEFLRILIDEIDFQRRTHGKLAEQIGISSGLLSRRLSGKNQFNFLSLIKLLNILYENDALQKQKLIHKFCLLTTSKQNLRIAMEYAHAKGDLNLLKLLVDQEKTSSLATNREWAYV
ncbi:AimR family lysis-lysogeny pheromone receptor, partial [Bacillus cereus]|nr:AimR family lysis-lysogeny pheromone receptor [Bacillus cereus]